MRMSYVALALVLAISVPADADSAADARPPAGSPIRSDADLRDYRYSLPAAPSEVFAREALLRDLASRLKTDAETILATRPIEDPTIRTQLHLGLVGIALLQGDSATARRWIEAERAAQTKPQLRSIGYLSLEGAAAALAASPERACAAAAETIAARLAKADPAIVREEAILRYGQALTLSEPYLASAVVVEIDPRYKTEGKVDLLDALIMPLWRAEIAISVPCRDPVAAAWRDWVNNPAHVPRDIWPERQPDAQAMAGAAPVVVAVWDTGVDTGLFAGQLARDPAEPLDGKDNDGNGVIDDIHGPSFGPMMEPTAFTVQPPSTLLAPQLDFQQVLFKGQADLNYGLDTPEARIMALRAREAGVAEQEQDIDAANEIGDRGHGTFVASQVLDGAPWARLYMLRMLPGGYYPKRVPTTEKEVEALIAQLPGTVARMRGAGVRVVNMSWVAVKANMARTLLQSGAETDPDRAMERAGAMYDRLNVGLGDMIRSAPDILFVAAAGNSNQSDDSYAALPQMIDAPNILVVGAVSRSGTPAAFTTFGRKVRIYAPGDAVKGRWTGGGTLLGSGTSYAAPSIARAAAAMLAVNPGLKPAQVIEGLLATATVGESGVRLVHPARAVDWARARPQTGG